MRIIISAILICLASMSYSQKKLGLIGGCYTDTHLPSCVEDTVNNIQYFLQLDDVLVSANNDTLTVDGLRDNLSDFVPCSDIKTVAVGCALRNQTVAFTGDFVDGFHSVPMPGGNGFATIDVTGSPNLTQNSVGSNLLQSNAADVHQVVVRFDTPVIDAQLRINDIDLGPETVRNFFVNGVAQTPTVVGAGTQGNPNGPWSSNQNAVTQLFSFTGDVTEIEFEYTATGGGLGIFLLSATGGFSVPTYTCQDAEGNETTLYRSDDLEIDPNDVVACPVTLEQLPDGIDTYGTVGSPEFTPIITTNGVTVDVGEYFVTFPDGTTWASDDFEHPDAGYAFCNTEDNLTNGGGGTGPFSAETTFTPHANGNYVFTYQGEVLSGTGGISVGTTAGASDIFVSSPATGDSDGSRITTTRQSNFTPPIALQEGVTYHITQWSGGGGNINNHTVCVADENLGNYIDTQVSNIDINCDRLSNRVVLNTDQLTVGADAAGETGFPVIGGTPNAATIQAWIDANVNYSLATTLQTTLDVPNQDATADITDYSFIESNILVPDGGATLNWNFTGEGYVRVEVDACGCGQYELVAEEHVIFDTPTGVSVPLTSGYHKVRVTQIDIQGSNNIFGFTSNVPVQFFAPSSGDLVATITEVLVDCDGNITDSDGNTITGEVLALGDYNCSIGLAVKSDDIIDLLTVSTEAIESYTCELPCTSFDPSGFALQTVPLTPIDYQDGLVETRYLGFFDGGFATATGLAVPQVRSFYSTHYNGTDWVIQTNNSPANQVVFTPNANTYLIARVELGASGASLESFPFECGDDVNGFQTIPQFGGLTISDNTFNGSGNAGELDVSGTWATDITSTVTICEGFNDLNSKLSNTPKTIAIDCYDVPSFIFQNPSTTEVGTTQGADGISWETVAVGQEFDRVTVLLRNTGAALTGVSYDIQDFDALITVATDPVDIPSGDSYVTFTFPVITVTAPIHANGELNLGGGGNVFPAQIVIPHTGNSSYGPFFNASNSESWIGSVSLSSDDTKVSVIRCSDGSQIAYDSNSTEVDITGGIPTEWEICPPDGIPNNKTTDINCLKILNEDALADTGVASGENTDDIRFVAPFDGTVSAFTFKIENTSAVDVNRRIIFTDLGNSDVTMTIPPGTSNITYTLDAPFDVIAGTVYNINTQQVTPFPLNFFTADNLSSGVQFTGGTNPAVAAATDEGYVGKAKEVICSNGDASYYPNGILDETITSRPANFVLGTCLSEEDEARIEELTSCCALDYTATQVYSPFNRNRTAGQVGNLVDIGTIVLNPTPVGAIQTAEISFISPCGNIPARVTVERIGTVQNEGQVTINTGNSFALNSDNGDFKTTWELLPNSDGEIPSVDWVIQPASYAGGAERLTFATDTEKPDQYIRGPGGIILDLNNPAPLNWHNTNNGISSAFLYEDRNFITYNTFQNNNLSSSLSIRLATGPAVIQVPFCDALDQLRNSITGDTSGGVLTSGAAFTSTDGVPVAIGDQYIQFPNGTTWKNSAFAQSFLLHNNSVNAEDEINIVDDNVPLLFSQVNGGTGQIIIPTLTYTLIEDGVRTDGETGNFDLEDGAIAFFHRSPIGNYFLTVHNQLVEGFGIDIDNGVISTDSTEISQQLQATIDERFCNIANASIDVQNVNDNGIIEWTQNATQGTWVDNGDNTFTYTGSPDWVEINAQIHQEIAQGAKLQRPNPVMVLQRSTDGGATWVEIAASASGYIRDFSDHEESSNSIFYRDFNAGTDPTYRLVSEQEALAGVVTSTFGQFDLEACENFNNGNN